jgi:hypothetical protein
MVVKLKMRTKPGCGCVPNLGLIEPTAVVAPERTLAALSYVHRAQNREIHKRQHGTR